MSHYNWRNNSRQGSWRDPEEIVKVPSNACGLIVGTGGRNVKELKEISGIRYIRVDFKEATVRIVGTEAGIAAVKRRIDQAVSLATNADGYFPECALSCLRLEFYSEIRFDRVSKAGDYRVHITQLDDHREYFVLNVVKPNVDISLDSLCLNDTDGETDKGELVAGFEPSKYMAFFDRVIRSNISAMSSQDVCAKVSVNFGKTFLSSVPWDVQGRSLSMSEISAIPYGKGGLRPEFVQHFAIDKIALLKTLQDDYVQLSAGKFIVVHCVSQETKKRYRIILKQRDGDTDADETARSDGNIRQIAEAKTYFEVLGISPSGATPRDVKIAFQRKALLIHPDKNNHPLAGKAMTVLNEARECLTNNQERITYESLPLPRQLPKNAFKYELAIASEPFPDVEKCRSRGRKLALCTVLSEAPRSEFRTTIETETDVAMDINMRRKLQRAWDERTSDGKFQFPNDDTDNWLIVDTVCYLERLTLTNGTFVLTVDKTTEDHFGKSCEGLNISLSSHDIMDKIKTLHEAVDMAGAASLLLTYIRDLQQEAMNISSLLDKL